jgi:uncharacterized membrane protein YdbT with pleckstrin-like domain
MKRSLVIDLAGVVLFVAAASLLSAVAPGLWYVWVVVALILAIAATTGLKVATGAGRQAGGGR